MSRLFNSSNIDNVAKIFQPLALGVNFSNEDYVGTFTCGRINTTTFIPSGSTYKCWVFRLNRNHQYIRITSGYGFICDAYDSSTFEFVNPVYLGTSGKFEIANYSGNYLIFQDEGSGYAGSFSNPYGRGAWWEDNFPLYQQNRITIQLDEEFSSFISARLAGKTIANPRVPSTLLRWTNANSSLIDVSERPERANISSFANLFAYNHRIRTLTLSNAESAKVTSLAYLANAAYYLEKFECGDLPKCSSLEYAFVRNPKLNNIKIGALKSGCNTTYAFRYCSNLTKIEIGYIDTIGQYCFAGCTKLENADFLKNVTLIDNFAFQNLTKLQVNKLCPRITSIGNSAFYGCISISLTTLPYSLTTLNHRSFYGCWNTSARSHSLYFESVPASINQYAFQSNSYLTLYVPWAEGEVANAPWSLKANQIHYMVPTGFRRLEYLECNGQQWIDTLHKVTSETRIRMVIFEANSGTLFQCYDSTRKYWGCTTENVNSIRYGLFHGSTQKGSYVTEGKMAEVGYEEDGNMNFCLNGNVIGEKSYSTISSYAINIPLFGFKNGSKAPTSLFSGKAGMTFISVRGENIKHFIPCLCLAGTTYIDAYTGNSVVAEADKPGYLDGFTGEFYTNKGTGDDFLYE